MSIESYGGLVIYNGVKRQTFTSTPRKMKWFLADSSKSGRDEGDQAIRPDYANNRIMVKPGTYLVMLSASGLAGAYDTTYDFFVRKEGAEYTQLHASHTTQTSDGGLHLNMSGIMVVTSAEADENKDVAVELYGESVAEESSSSTTNSSSLSSSTSSTNSSSSSSSSSTSSSSSSSVSSSSSSSTVSSSSSSSTSSNSSSSTNSSSSSSSSSSSLSSSSSSSSSGEESSSSSTSSSSSSSSSSTSSSSNSSSSSSSGPAGQPTVTFHSAQFTLVRLYS